MSPRLDASRDCLRQAASSNGAHRARTTPDLAVAVPARERHARGGSTAAAESAPYADGAPQHFEGDPYTGDAPRIPAPRAAAGPDGTGHRTVLDPREVDPREVDPLDARALSKTLFARLTELEEGTHEYAYVRNTLIELNLALVKFAASRFRSRSEPMEDIIQVGTIGLIKAIDRFELSRGVEFPTFAMPTIIGEIKRFFRDTSWSVRVPRRLQELRLDLVKAGDELAQQLDRSPTVAELAQRLGISQDEVVEGMAASNAYSATSLDAHAAEDDTEATLAARIGYEDHGIEGIEYVESLKPMIARLPSRDRLILSLRFVANMTQSEIGEELGISQMHVSRLLSRTLAKLRRGLLADE
ncbi:RNA polymerase sigma factor SigF [Streptomyces gamaensis]|uniref:RNA polymerase sigma factor SigF n=1 Tax=Streptomyces gamaensis TaxID=1763542 RepID=A0ABW0Z300_9ACTN